MTKEMRNALAALAASRSNAFFRWKDYCDG
jgi:hypothetical protein